MKNTTKNEQNFIESKVYYVKNDNGFFALNRIY